MNKEQIIESALNRGIKINKITCGIFDQWQAYNFAPVNEDRFKYRDGMYHVSCNLNRSELLSGVRLMAERMGIALHGFPSK